MTYSKDTNDHATCTGTCCPKCGGRLAAGFRNRNTNKTVAVCVYTGEVGIHGAEVESWEAGKRCNFVATVDRII
jgi:hypothetical protein